MLSRSSTAGAIVGSSSAQVIEDPVQSPVKSGVGVLQVSVHLRPAMADVFEFAVYRGDGHFLRVVRGCAPWSDLSWTHRMAVPCDVL